MSQSTTFDVLHNAAIEAFIKKKVEERDLKSILEVEVRFKSVKTGKKVFFFFSKKKQIGIVRFKVNEELSIIEHMTKGLDFKELAGKREYEIIYV
ncbi:gp104 [Bacillus phage G]|uniref:Gp104 n=1 Tax=Bacillus phage G TaxID=2884420 RepID=G3MBG6_9CAUD|nr:gp104 [Bacillus phage G]AEO93366.1 gp104 [Bacillus phage G]